MLKIMVSILSISFLMLNNHVILATEMPANIKILDSFAGVPSSAEVAASSGNVYVLWSRGNSNIPPQWDMFLARSIDNGLSFESEINLNEHFPGEPYAKIVASGNHVYITWSGNGDILFRRSTNNATSFEPVLDISKSKDVSQNPQIATSGNYVYIVWVEIPAENYESCDMCMIVESDVFLSLSTDYGATFSAPVNLSKGLDPISVGPSIASFDSNVYIAWENEPDWDTGPWVSSIVFVASNDYGATFSPAVKLDTRFFVNLPRVSAFGDNVYVVWSGSERYKNDEIFLAASDNAGATFREIYNLSQTDTDSFHVQIVSNGNNVYAAWSDGDPMSREILFRASNNNGTNFGRTINLSQSSQDSLSATLAVNGKNVYVTWYDDGTGIFLAQSNDFGNSFSAAVKVSHDKGGYGSSIDIWENNVYMSWISRGDGSNILFTTLDLLDQMQIYEMKIDDKTYPIRYKITSGEMKSMFVDLSAHAIVIVIDSNESGQLTVELPRNIIDSKNDGKDKSYYVAIGNYTTEQGMKAIAVKEIETTFVKRVLTIDYREGTTLIEIAGTNIVPEFPLAFIVLGMCFAVFVMIRRFPPR